MKTAREEILEKLKNSVHPVLEKSEFDSPIYHSIEKPLDMTFKENLEKASGTVNIFSSEKELFEGLNRFLSAYNKNQIVCFETEIISRLKDSGYQLTDFEDIPKDIEVGITGCEYLIAHTGSVMVSSAQKGGRRMFVYPPVHVIVAKRDQLVEYLENAYTGIIQKYNKTLPSHIALITGPSRTADIEKTMVMGAHGPREMNVFIA